MKDGGSIDKAEITKDLWSSTDAAEVAANIASRYGVYCGPASVVWIAALWNQSQGRPYAYMNRLVDKSLFPDGPRPFSGSLPGFELNLSDLLKRETQGDLRLSSKTYFGYRNIHRALTKSAMPMILRLPSMSFRNGLHYVTVYKSENTNELFRFHFQDNGVYKSDVKLVNGLGVMSRGRGPLKLFTWGAKQVINNE